MPERTSATRSRPAMVLRQRVSASGGSTSSTRPSLARERMRERSSPFSAKAHAQASTSPSTKRERKAKSPSETAMWGFGWSIESSFRSKGSLARRSGRARSGGCRKAVTEP
nr:MAG TPA: hypothetical protein [Caudoviricetes sp.]